MVRLTASQTQKWPVLDLNSNRLSTGNCDAEAVEQKATGDFKGRQKHIKGAATGAKEVKEAHHFRDCHLHVSIYPMR